MPAGSDDAATAMPVELHVSEITTPNGGMANFKANFYR
jgi:hypothetical protein